MDQTVLLKTIQFTIGIGDLFALRLNVKQFYLTYKWDPISCHSFRVRVDLGAMTMKWFPTFPKSPALLEPQHHIVIYRTLVGRSDPLCRDAVGVFNIPSRLGYQLG